MTKRITIHIDDETAERTAAAAKRAGMERAAFRRKCFMAGWAKQTKKRREKESKGE